MYPNNIEYLRDYADTLVKNAAIYVAKNNKNKVFEYGFAALKIKEQLVEFDPGIYLKECADLSLDLGNFS